MFRAIKATAATCASLLFGSALLPSVYAETQGLAQDDFLCRDDIPWMLPATYCDSWMGTTGGGTGGGGIGYAYDPWWRGRSGGSTSGSTNGGWLGDGGGSGSGSGSGWFGGGGSTGSGYTGNPWWRVGSGGTLGSSDQEWFGGGTGGGSSNGSGWLGGGGSTGSRDPYDPWWRNGYGRSTSGNTGGDREWFGGGGSGKNSGGGTGEEEHSGQAGDTGTSIDDGYSGGGPLAWCDPTYTSPVSWIAPKKRVVHITKPPFTRAALDVTQSTDVQEGYAGTSVHFAIRVHNLSNYYANDVIVLDKLMPELLCIEHAPFAYVGQRNLLWYVDFIPPHSSQLIQFRARIRPTVQGNTVLHNTVLAQTDGPHLRVMDVHDLAIVGK